MKKPDLVYWKFLGVALIGIVSLLLILSPFPAIRLSNPSTRGILIIFNTLLVLYIYYSARSMLVQAGKQALQDRFNKSGGTRNSSDDTFNQSPQLNK